jgi:hypothetical protein
MNPSNILSARRAAGWLLGLVLLCAGLHAAAEPAGRLNFHQGAVSFSPAGAGVRYQAEPSRPLVSGDRLWTERDGRAEVFIDSTAVRLDAHSALDFTQISDDVIRLTLTQGAMQVRVRDAPAGRRLEIATVNAAVLIGAPGDYRIDVDPASDATRIAVAAGSATLFGENGEAAPLQAGQQLTVTGRHLAQAGAPRANTGDFDRWVAERDRFDDESLAARYAPGEAFDYQQLDAYGSWGNDPAYGAVWYPRDVAVDWTPWIGVAPWGIALIEYGQWRRIGPRWGWIPSPRYARPVHVPVPVRRSAPIAPRHGPAWRPSAPPPGASRAEPRQPPYVHQRPAAPARQERRPPRQWQDARQPRAPQPRQMNTPPRAAQAPSRPQMQFQHSRPPQAAPRSPEARSHGADRQREDRRQPGRR